MRTVSLALLTLSAIMLSLRPATSLLSRAFSKPIPIALFSTAASPSQAAPKIPITLLAGFLGAGKTSALRHILTSDDHNLKIGVVVNDVAEVNIDSKLITNAVMDSEANGGQKVFTVELQNGCACCSLSDELLTSIDSLLNLQDTKEPFDRIVVELSGVADPNAVVGNLEAAAIDKHPVADRVRFDNVVTLIDASTFGSDWMSWNTVGDRDGWADPDDECAGSLKVTELMAEQVECADVILVNKIDVATSDEKDTAMKMARSLNTDAGVHESEFGKASLANLLMTRQLQEPADSEAAHDHSHDHTECAEPACDHPSHSHEHDHATCDDPTHDHSHDSAPCEDANYDDPTHAHSHDSAPCEDAKCDDPTHDHSHIHNHSSHSSDATVGLMKDVGISSFTYRASKPFDMTRLLSVLNTWPVPKKEELDLVAMSKYGTETTILDGEPINNPFVSIVRSKGFCWMAPSSWADSATGGDQWRHETAMYWSHAGKHFGITTAGKWWASLESKEQVKDFLSSRDGEYERMMKEDWVSEEFGDRRQELVFIGVDYDEAKIRSALNECLVSDAEFDDYRARLTDYKLAILDSADGASLFSGAGHVESN